MGHKSGEGRHFTLGPRLVAGILALLAVAACTTEDVQPPSEPEAVVSTSSPSTPGPVPWKRLEGDPWPHPDPPLAGLPIALDLIAPRSANPGQPYEFVVRISNTGDRLVSLDPCPAYRVQYLPSVEVGYLNCDEAPREIAAGSHVDFEMRIDVPDVGNPDIGGSYQLLWQLGGEGVEGKTVRQQVPLATPEWRTIEHAGVEVDVPGEWVELDTAECDVSAAGVADFEVGLRRPPTSGIHPCDSTSGLRISEATRFDHTLGLTDSGGEVVVGDQLLQILIGDRELARRILASARPTGTAPIDVDTWSVRDLGSSVTVEVPDRADVRVARTGGIPACTIGSTPSPAQPTDDGQWRAGYCRNVIVTVVAPTEALATIIAATVDDTR